MIFYDLDGTLIKTKGTNTYPNGRDDWAWWHPSVPKRLKQEVDEGKHLIVISNQGDSREKIRSEWKAKVPLIAAKVSRAARTCAIQADCRYPMSLCASWQASLRPTFTASRISGCIRSSSSSTERRGMRSI